MVNGQLRKRSPVMVMDTSFRWQWQELAACVFQGFDGEDNNTTRFERCSKLDCSCKLRYQLGQVLAQYHLPRRATRNTRRVGSFPARKGLVCKEIL